MSASSCRSLCLYVVLAACGSEHDHDHPHPHPVATPAPGDGGHVHSERTRLGQVELAGHTITVQRVAPIEAGKEADFDLDFGKAPLPSTVRVWVGVESAIGSRKCRFERETDLSMHGHPEVPDPIPAGAAVWVEVEVDGKSARAAVPLAP